MLDLEVRIKGMTKKETICQALLNAYFLGRYRARFKRAKKPHKDFYKMLLDTYGNYAQIALLRMNLFDHILRLEGGV